MASAQAAVRHRQGLDELCAAAVRALAGDGELHFRGHRLFRGRQRLPLYAAHLHPDAEVDDLATLRGAADGLALRLAHSDEALHRALQPQEPIERALSVSAFGVPLYVSGMMVSALALRQLQTVGAP